MSDNEGVQFDRAEYETAPSQAACAECSQPLAGHYYDVNGQTVCERCRYAIESRFNGGSRIGRLVRATGGGVVAAALGALLYYAIAALTGYEFGLIAIVVGFGVGTAVRWGSNGRGGWLYQTLAIALTYLAIVSTYIPPILDELSKLDAETTTESAGQDLAATPASETTDTAAETAAAASETTDTAAETATPAGETAEIPAEASAETASEPPPPVFAVVLILMTIAIAAPFLAGFENIIGLVIIGIGLYEAWKLNRRTELTISGPHALAAQPAHPVVG
jgi:hypothetical protein